MMHINLLIHKLNPQKGRAEGNGHMHSFISYDPGQIGRNFLPNGSEKLDKHTSC
jgi:hypothetical protein